MEIATRYPDRSYLIIAQLEKNAQLLLSIEIITDYLIPGKEGFDLQISYIHVAFISMANLVL